MFRFLHAADLHLDSPLRGLAARAEAPAEALRGASRRAFDRFIRLAIDEAVDFVVIAGDIYDGDWKDYNTGLYFRSRMVQLKQAEIPVFMISGNHDAVSTISRKLSLPENVSSFSSRNPETQEPDKWPVALHGMSFPQRKVSESLLPRYPQPVADKFNIGILHTSLAGAEGHDSYAPCSLSDLCSKGYDYWALGHVHQPAILHQDPWVVYSGNIQGRHARECGERGCWLVSVDDSLEVSDCQWQTLDVARWACIEVELGDVNNTTELISRTHTQMSEALKQADGRLLALRVILKGTTKLHGQLCSDPSALEAEITACAQDFGEDAIWLERLKIATRPSVSLTQLAENDALTRVVLDALDQSTTTELPTEVTAMLNTLPHELRESLRESWSGDGLQKLKDDACAMILERLKTKGAEQ